MTEAKEAVSARQRPTLPRLKRTLRAHARSVAPLFTLTVLIVFFSLASEGGRFFTAINLVNILQQAAALAIMATGVTFVLLTAEIDLSIASMAMFAGVLASHLLVNAGVPGTLAFLISFVVAIVLGLVNGVVTTRFRLPSFMTTLAMMQIANGLAIFITKGRPFFEVPAIALALGNGRLGPIPVILIVAVIVLAVGHIVLTYTRFGRYVYMVGGNREAAELSGISTTKIRTLALMIGGATAGLAGLINTGRIGSAHAGGFEDMLLAAISAVVLGGTSLFGGEGGIPNTIIGLLIFAVLGNGLNLINLDIYLKTVVTGLILLIALIINVYSLKLGAEAEQEAGDERKK